MPQTVFISFHTVCLLLNIAAIKWSILTKYKYWFVDKKKFKNKLDWLFCGDEGIWPYPGLKLKQIYCRIVQINSTKQKCRLLQSHKWESMIFLFQLGWWPSYLITHLGNKRRLPGNDISDPRRWSELIGHFPVNGWSGLWTLIEAPTCKTLNKLIWDIFKYFTLVILSKQLLIRFTKRKR